MPINIICIDTVMYRMLENYFQCIFVNFVYIKLTRNFEKKLINMLIRTSCFINI